MTPPQPVMAVLETLWGNGHAAYLVGGGVRDELLGQQAKDWDVATDARPERVAELFPDARYENRFGTVNVPGHGDGIEVTTFRRDHLYADHRRPDTVTFTDSLEEDLARRDFTVNAIAWGRAANSGTDALAWFDPTGGRADISARMLRAVGDAAARFDEDGLRLLRAARLVGQLDFTIEAATLAAMSDTAETIRWISNERVGEEVRRMLETDVPSKAFEILADTGVLAHVLPELDAQRGVPQDKAPGMDLWRHTMATVDAAAADGGDPRLTIAALLHDIGKPSTAADGHFIGHEVVGAEMASKVMSRLAFGRRETEFVAGLIRNHMFRYEPKWSDAAVRRFIRRVGLDLIDGVLSLRAVDNMGSGLPGSAGHLDELKNRIDKERRFAPLSLAQLAVNGDDLVAELGMTPGRQVGQLLEALLADVIADPAANDRATLIEHGRSWLASAETRS
jgi:tRNA nucleotidyltransferase (CCA-adding enzyme)